MKSSHHSWYNKQQFKKNLLLGINLRQKSHLACLKIIEYSKTFNINRVSTGGIILHIFLFFYFSAQKKISFIRTI